MRGPLSRVPLRIPLRCEDAGERRRQRAGRRDGQAGGGREGERAVSSREGTAARAWAGTAWAWAGGRCLCTSDGRRERRGGDRRKASRIMLGRAVRVRQGPRRGQAGAAKVGGPGDLYIYIYIYIHMYE